MKANDPDFLEHFGVKGMKWGVRKESDASSKRLSLSDPKVKRAAIAGVAVTGLIAAALIANHYGKGISSLDPSTISKGAEKAKSFLEQPTDIIYSTKLHKGSGVTKNGFEVTAPAFISKGNTKDFFEIFDKAGLNNGSLTSNTMKKMPNGDVAAIISDLSGRVDRAGRTIPHSVLIPASKASGLNNVEDVIAKYGPELERRYEAYLTVRRQANT